jgi:O-antigen/teichoic acid export membrane protein
MSGMAVVSTILTQTDKVAVGKMLPLPMLGYYSLAGAVASVPLMLALPVASAVFPRLTALVETGNRIGLAKLYHKTCQLVSVATIPAGLTVALFAGDLILAWTGSALTAQRAGLATSFLVGGQLMQAITVVPFYIALAHADIRLNLRVGIASVLLITPLLIWLISKYGILGGGISWTAMNLCTLPPYMYFLHRRLLPGELRRWALRDVLRPLTASLPVILVARLFLPVPDGRAPALVAIGMVFMVSTAAAALGIPQWRMKAAEKMGIRFGVPDGV